jgi:predicted PurR-regulated permease PerM
MDKRLTVVACVLALYIIYVLRKPLTWIFIAGFIAIALSGPVNFLQRRMRRGFAVAIVYAALVLVPILIMAALIPPIVTQGNNLAQSLPDYARDVTTFVQKDARLRKLEKDYDITAKLEEQAAKLPARRGDAAGVLSDIGVGIVNSLFAAITIIVLSVFMLQSARGWLDALADRYPPDHARWLKRLYDRIGATVGNYVAGALLQATIAGVLAWIVLSILGVPYALPLSVVVFLLDLVPLVGATLGAIIVGVVTLFSDFPVDTIVWVIFSVIYQQVENTVIQPRIQARAVAVHPLVVLVSVLFGSTLFGVLGALLAIPVAAAIQITIREYHAFKNTPAEDLPPPGVPAPETGAGPATAG